MVEVARVSCLWQGFTGSPGYTKFSFGNVTDVSSAAGATTAARTFFSALTAYLRTGWTITVDPVVEMHDMDTGMLLRQLTVTPSPTVVSGTALTSVNWLGGTGATITWRTNGIFFGRRVKGRTYVVPLVGIADTDGTLLTAALSAIQGAADALVNSASGDLVIWSRKYSTDTHPTQIQGAINSATAAAIKDVTGILKSRRD